MEKLERFDHFGGLMDDVFPLVRNCTELISRPGDPGRRVSSDIHELDAIFEAECAAAGGGVARRAPLEKTERSNKILRAAAEAQRAMGNVTDKVACSTNHPLGSAGGRRRVEFVDWLHHCRFAAPEPASRSKRRKPGLLVSFSRRTTAWRFPHDQPRESE